MDENYLSDQLIAQVAKAQNVKISQIRAVLQLIVEENATIQFIARYRKEVTGNLDEEQIRAIYQEWDYGKKLAERKEDVRRLIEEKGRLTPEINEAIKKATKLAELEDIYRPFKEKKKTRATEAKKKGLEPLAEYLLSFPDGSPEDVLAEAGKYVTVLPDDEEKVQEMIKEGVVVNNIDEALNGAKDIIAEIVSDEPTYRTWIRKEFVQNATIKTEVREGAKDEKQVYGMYYAYEEPLKTIKLHRVLAINRGENEKVLKVWINENVEKVLNYILSDVIKKEDSITAPYVKDACTDGYLRLIKPSIEREIRSELKEKAENQAIHIFGENLRNYLLQPPMKDRIVLGIDPAYRTGCKMAVVDPTGKVLVKSVMYPHQKNINEKVPEERYQQAVRTFLELVNNYDVDIVAIGNGTASRETEAFVAENLKKL
ncbi:MAG TPA: Tex-like N-terminal domain-containing protein, partial [Bacilli bacterium]|nr:Tex-like N-terminal domain-containing protein [Bacilli bacterium]